jgi:hypothetical protein
MQQNADGEAMDAARNQGHCPKNRAQYYEICAGERASAVEVGRWMVTVVP